jgi:catechol 2,3-dioxygenase-like lactoylglutathione lyase family enzyme
MAAGIGGIDHYSIRTEDIEAAVAFYEKTLNLVAGPRPPFDFPGAWLYRSERNGQPAGSAFVHVIGVAPGANAGLHDYLGKRDPVGRTGTGAFDHIALRAEGLTELRARLAQHGIPFRERTVPLLGVHQVFLEDPCGVTIELNFGEAEAAASPPNGA